MLKSPFIYPLCLGMAATTGCHQNNENAKTTHTPNIIILLADDMGYNDASAYRNLNAAVSDQPPTSVTSAIDSLAANGMLFTDFYCGAAVCSPSRAVMLTGRNATRLGIYNWIPSNSPMHLRSSEITLAEMLKRKDYHTAHFGKWHLTSENRDDQPRPNDQGYVTAFLHTTMPGLRMRIRKIILETARQLGNSKVMHVSLSLTKPWGGSIPWNQVIPSI